MYPLDELFESAGFSLEDDYDENIAQKEINGHYYSLPASASHPPFFTTRRCLMMQKFLIQVMTGLMMSSLTQPES